MEMTQVVILNEVKDLPLTIVTRNTGDFVQLGVKTLNPFET